MNDDKNDNDKLLSEEYLLSEQKTIIIKAKSRSFIVAPNIAIIKYWGKEEENDIIPINPSLSFAMPFEMGYTETHVELIERSEEDYIIELNGNLSTIKENNKRYLRIIEFIKTIYKMYYKDETHNLDEYNIKIVSNNSFPTACGLSSSSSGALALVLSLVDVFNINFEDMIDKHVFEDINFKGKCEGILLNVNDIIKSGLARIGSGSACRGLYPFAYWDNFGLKITSMIKPTNQKDCDHFKYNCLLNDINILIKSFSIPISTNLINDLSVIVVTVNKYKKKVSSTNGMKQTVSSSVLFNGLNNTTDNDEDDDLTVRSGNEESRIEGKAHIVNESIYLRARIARQRLENIFKLINSYETLPERREDILSNFFEIIMKDAMTFHALCLDTYPPIFYLNSISFEIINTVQSYNESVGRNVAAYTFDAGPNCVIFCDKEFTTDLEHKLKDITGIINIISGKINTTPYIIK